MYWSNLVQDFLTEKIDKGFIKHNEWPPASPDCNPLDYYFWDKIKIEVYGDRFDQACENEEALKKNIKKIWHEVSNDLKEMRSALKQFIPRLTAVQEKDGQCIKMLFDWIVMILLYIFLFFSLFLILIEIYNHVLTL